MKYKNQEKLKIGKLEIIEHISPRIEVFLGERLIGYLCITKEHYGGAYVFQVTSIIDHILGHFCQSCNNNIELYRFLNIDEDVEVKIFSMLSMQAINNTANIFNEFTETTVVVCIDEYDETWEKFIEESIKWIRNMNREGGPYEENY